MTLSHSRGSYLYGRITADSDTPILQIPNDAEYTKLMSRLSNATDANKLFGAILQKESRLADNNQYHGHVFAVRQEDDLLFRIRILQVNEEKKAGDDIYYRDYVVSMSQDRKFKIEEIVGYKIDENDVIHTNKIDSTDLSQNECILDASQSLAQQFPPKQIHDLSDTIEFIEEDQNIERAFKYYKIDDRKLDTLIKRIANSLEELASSPNTSKEILAEISALQNDFDDKDSAYSKFQSDVLEHHTILNNEIKYHRVLAKNLHALAREFDDDINASVKLDTADEKSRDNKGIDVTLNAIAMQNMLEENMEEISEQYKEIQNEFERLRKHYASMDPFKHIRNIPLIKLKEIENNQDKNLFYEFLSSSKKADMKTLEKLIDLAHDANIHDATFQKLAKKLVNLESENEERILAISQQLDWIPGAKLDASMKHPADFLSGLSKIYEQIQGISQKLQSRTKLLHRGASQFSHNLESLLGYFHSIFNDQTISNDLKNTLRQSLSHIPYIEVKNNEIKIMKERYISDIKNQGLQNVAELDEINRQLEGMFKQVESLQYRMGRVTKKELNDQKDQLLLALISTNEDELTPLLKRFYAQHAAVREKLQSLLDSVNDVKRYPELASRVQDHLHQANQLCDLMTDDVLNKKLEQYIKLATSYRNNVAEQCKMLQEDVFRFANAYIKAKKLNDPQLNALLAELVNINKMDQLVACMNKIIKHDYVSWHNNTLSYTLREHLQKNPLAQFYSFEEDKRDDKKRMNFNFEGFSESCGLENIKDELETRQDAYKGYVSRFSEINDQLVTAVKTEEEALKAILQARKELGDALTKLKTSRFEMAKEAYGKRYDALQSSNATQLNHLFKEFKARDSDLSAIINTIKKQYDELNLPTISLEEAKKIETSMRRLLSSADKQLSGGMQRIKHNIATAHENRVASQQRLLVYLRKITLDNLANWSQQQKSGSSVSYEGTAYHNIPHPINEIAKRFIQLEEEPIADPKKALTLILQGIADKKSSFSQLFKQKAPATIEIDKVLKEIANRDLDDVDKLQISIQQLKTRVDVMNPPTRGRSAAMTSQLFTPHDSKDGHAKNDLLTNRLEELYARLELLIKNPLFWKMQGGNQAYFSPEIKTEIKLPKRVKQMNIAIDTIRKNTVFSALEKMHILLGRNSGFHDKDADKLGDKPGFFKKEPRSTKRTSFTTELYDVMETIHKGDLTNAAQVGVFLAEVNKLQNKINEDIIKQKSLVREDRSSPSKPRI
jgi:DNA-directed RNA polymerase subunit L